jgi:hypothetical protein
MRHHTSGVLDERGEQLVLDRGQVDFLAAQQHLALHEVDFQVAGLKLWLSGAGSRRVAERHANARGARAIPRFRRAW